MSGDQIDHDFLPVLGHPDDDECTYRSDGTDDTYCGLPEEAHGNGGEWLEMDEMEIDVAPAAVQAFRDAERLRSLAATFDSHYNRVKTYTGAQVAAMLRDGEG